MTVAESNEEAASLWIFGYGSLVWRPNLPHPPLRKLVGVVHGYKRRFWQGSTDHRGLPGAPGRVVTLLEDDSAATWGVAYQVANEHRAEVLDYLDYREKGGYALHRALFTPQDPLVPKFEVQVYVATPDNVDYLGPAPPNEMAQQIYRSVGPSGNNKDYLYSLADAMRRLAPEVSDDHLYGLEGRVRQLDGQPQNGQQR